jgi:hypothetical protein
LEIRMDSVMQFDRTQSFHDARVIVL